jgi:cysteinyl-tRNA synthetase
MLRKFYEDKIKEAEKTSLNVKKSMKGSLDVENVAISSETHGTGEIKKEKSKWEETIKDDLNVKDVTASSKTSDAGEEKERKEILAGLKEEMDSLTERLDGLRREQFVSSRALKKQELDANFNGIEQLQKLQSRMRKEICEIGNDIRYISKLCFNYGAEFSEEGIIINLAEDSEVDPATKAVQDQCLSLMGDLQACTKRFIRDDEIIDKIKNQEQDESFGLDQLYREE